jgi:hypothetical protein
MHSRSPPSASLPPELPPQKKKIPLQVSISSNYAALVVGVLVIVGFATDLDPRVNLVDAAVPAFLSASLTGRVMGRLYS